MKMSCRYLESVLSIQDNFKMSCRYLENVLSRQDNSKTILRCLEDVLCRLGSKNTLHYLKEFNGAIPNFGISTAILNTIDISRWWCKLNFGLLRDHVKSCHFPEWIGAGRRYFYFFIHISWNNWKE